ncbi:hypothetical protein ACFL1I_00615 [Candidatus Omnitrophota bacterium]
MNRETVHKWINILGVYFIVMAIIEIAFALRGMASSYDPVFVYSGIGRFINAALFFYIGWGLTVLNKNALDWGLFVIALSLVIIGYDAYQINKHSNNLQQQIKYFDVAEYDWASSRQYAEAEDFYARLQMEIPQVIERKFSVSGEEMKNLMLQQQRSFFIKKFFIALQIVLLCGIFIFLSLPEVRDQF